MSHTPGPWNFVWDAKHDRHVLMSPTDAGFGHFVGWSADGITNEEEDEANLRLIAAAPETAAQRDRLLAVNAELVAAVEMTDLHGVVENARRKWRADHAGMDTVQALVKGLEEQRDILLRACEDAARHVPMMRAETCSETDRARVINSLLSAIRVAKGGVT